MAGERGYDDPVNPTYEATGEMYDRVIGHLLTEMKVAIISVVFMLN